MFSKAFGRILIMALVILSFSTISSAQNDISVPIRVDKDYELISKAINRFAFDLFKEIVESEGDSNILISPFSISYALGMTYNGAGGATKDSMAKALCYDSHNDLAINRSYKSLAESFGAIDSMIAIKIANSIWYRYGLKVEQDFLDINSKYFDSEVLPSNFSDPEVCRQINDWIAGKTENKIQDMLACPIGPDVIMYIINAIYFKGIWTYRFDPEQTREMRFYHGDRSYIPCDMMMQRNEYLYQVNDKFQAIELPYGDGRLKMAIFLPAKDNALDRVMVDLTYENWNIWQGGFAKDSVTLYLPKFRIKYGILLNDPLIALGMGNAFGGADFSHLSKSARIFISRVLHNTFVQVDEQGTEASAVTIVEVKKGPGPPQNSMMVNRPFIYIIHDSETGAILFLGRINKPIWNNG